MSFDFEPETQSSILGFRRPFKAFAGVGKLLESFREVPFEVEEDYPGDLALKSSLGLRG